MKTLQRIWNEQRDALISALIFILAFALYVRTLAPSVAFIFDDTLEFHYVIPRLGILHPTGYPLYTLLGKLFTLIVPLDDPAFRLNLFAALTGALAVAMVYLVARHLVAYRSAAILSALTFAVGQTFWEQAVAAEVYTLQMLIAALLVYLALIWREEIERGNETEARRRFYQLAFMMGLGLTHHRLILLLYPALALYVLLVNRAILRDLRLLARAFVLFFSPLLLYLYLPLRGAVGSANGMYQNTLQGFIAWVTAQQYLDFVTQNPLRVERDATYYGTLFQDQLTTVGIALAAVGLAWLLRRRREWALLVLALVAEAGFAFNYRTADVQVHFLTAFFLLALFLGAGAELLLTILSNLEFRISNFEISFLLLPTASLLLLLVPLYLLTANYSTSDLSFKWDVHDYGLDILSQPLEKNATIVGILGEMTLLRYFQETQNIRPDVQTIAADDEKARLAVVESVLKQNRIVYLTRPLKGAAEKYSLSSSGPLIRVNPHPVMGDKNHRLLGKDLGAGIQYDYELDTSRLTAIPNRWHAENGRFLRVTLHWFAEEKINTDAMVSVKVLRKDQRIVGQIDHRPVLDAYPTTAWRPGEVILDTYDVPIFLGVTPSDYIVNVTLYDAATGAVVGQSALTQLALGPDLQAPRRAVWNIAHSVDAEFGALALAGYSLETITPVRPGDGLPLTLLWRAGASKLPDNLLARMWLEDSGGKTVASRDAPISVGFPPWEWQPNAYVRDWPLMRVPANIPDGKYTVKLAVAQDNQLLGSALLPFQPTVAGLGRIEIKNRARLMNAPAIARPLEATFDRKIKLLGYDLKLEPARRSAQLILYWKAVALIDTSYTVFVHVLDAQSKVVASADAVPGGGEFPTTGWIEDEYVTDLHPFALPNDLPPGTYGIEIGLYDPASGARLKTGDGQDHVILESVETR